MKCDDTTIRVETFEDFDRELARDGGETLEVEAELAGEYGLFPEDVGTEDEIAAAWGDPHGAAGEEVDG
ncbi:MAG: hypothetical protein F4Y24_01405 [Gemmatimonadetes bacterium]|nr:hypothetical protein [Gammaproteobacteria bacterium]MYB04987.1 hypothetical protein [Gemmatimonadota bacterium]MYG22580.1 hypothetical protein [Gemmatimonadota bacterium]MYJ38887.1 hypothetical protein [Gemmatimonadota bacterium]